MNTIPHGEIPAGYIRWNSNKNMPPSAYAMYWSASKTKWVSRRLMSNEDLEGRWIIEPDAMAGSELQVGDIVTWGSCAANGKIIEKRATAAVVQMSDVLTYTIEFGGRRVGSPLRLATLK